MSELIITLEDVNPIEFYGANNSNITLLKKAFPRLKVVSRGDKIKIAGNSEDIQRFRQKVSQMIKMTDKKGRLSTAEVESLLFDQPLFEANDNKDPNAVLVHGTNGVLVRAKTANQRKLVKLSEQNDILFAIGPAGTGKTYTAVALAVRALKNNIVKKIILTRPAVEAGENLGFLPGDLKEKIDPYLRPLYDALDDMIPIEKLNYYMANRIIEVAPLAFMRGRTLDNAFIILDEAQNATNAQLKMFLTRIGPSAKCIITGDLTQIDLPKNQNSGLVTAVNILSSINGIATVYLTEADVIRHKLVKKIIGAYAKIQDQNKNDHPKQANE